MWTRPHNPLAWYKDKPEVEALMDFYEFCCNLRIQGMSTADSVRLDRIRNRALAAGVLPETLTAIRAQFGP